MRQIYKSHGSHCHLRSFQTKCPKCGATVLYWECTHGCKVFFNYPPYGKLVRHYCRVALNEKTKNKYPVIVKPPCYLSENPSPSCPICGKLFKTENDLNKHLRQSKERDSFHKLFYSNEIAFKSDKFDKGQEKKDKSKVQYNPLFGRINIKKRNQ